MLYIFWIKWAELETLNAGYDNGTEIFERSVNYIPKSTELWTYYCLHVVEHSLHVDEIRGIFERAIAMVGMDFLSQPIWESYLDFEMSQEEYGRVTALLQRVLTVPLRELDQYWMRFKAHASTRLIVEMAIPEQQALLSDLPEEQQRHQIMEWHERIFLRTNAELQQIRPFEIQLTRTYFHVQPMDDEQLNIWRHYLIMEEQRGNHARIVHLYEKCLIPCCAYTEFWGRYLGYLERCGRIDDARNVVLRMATIFLKRKPESYLIWAEFEEQCGDAQRARDVFRKLVDDVAPGHLQSFLHFIAFERRQGNINAALHLFERALALIRTVPAKAYLVMEYANFLSRNMQDVDAARRLYRIALGLSITSSSSTNGLYSMDSRFDIDLSGYKNLWIAYLCFEISEIRRLPSKQHEDLIFDTFERPVTDTLKFPNTDRLDLLHRLLDFALTHCTSVSRVRRLQYFITITENELSPLPSSIAASLSHPTTAPSAVAATSSHHLDASVFIAPKLIPLEEHSDHLMVKVPSREDEQHITQLSSLLSRTQLGTSSSSSPPSFTLSPGTVNLSAAAPGNFISEFSNFGSTTTSNPAISAIPASTSAFKLFHHQHQPQQQQQQQQQSIMLPQSPQRTAQPFSAFQR